MKLIAAHILLALSATRFSLAAGDDDKEELRFVVVMYRHGDRTPVRPYPNDPHKDPSNW